MAGGYCMHCGGMVGEDGYALELGPDEFTENAMTHLSQEEQSDRMTDAGFGKAVARKMAEGGMVGDVSSSGGRVYRKDESGYTEVEPSENYKNWKKMNPAKAQEYEADAGVQNYVPPKSFEDRAVFDAMAKLKRKAK